MAARIAAAVTHECRCVVLKRATSHCTKAIAKPSPVFAHSKGAQPSPHTQRYCPSAIAT